MDAATMRGSSLVLAQILPCALCVIEVFMSKLSNIDCLLAGDFGAVVCLNAFIIRKNIF